jgi:dihydropteroate synthase
LETKVSPFSSKKTLNLSGKLYDLSVPLVMGIINVTPDSFYDGGRYLNNDALTNRLKQLIEDKVDIIDIGGYSTRPGAFDITSQEEIQRVVPAIRKSRSIAPEIPVSIDTFRSEVAEAAIDAVANMVNDVSGGNLDHHMFELVAEKQLPYVLMHMRGDPRSMNAKAKYDNLITEIIRDLSRKMSMLNDLGLNDIIVDPGFGFAKNADHNFLLLKELEAFQIFEAPIMVGLSRKSMIYKTLNVSTDETLVGTSVLNTIALSNGASILRVHDVLPARQAIELFIKTTQQM